MPIRILSDGKFSDAVPPETQLEKDFETLILENSGLIFPGWTVLDFKRYVESAHSKLGKMKPDFILIDTQNWAWWVVEVELAHHSVENHIAPQVEVLATAHYSHEHVKYCQKAFAHAENNHQIEQMILSTQPKVLVIVNDFVKDWKNILQPWAEILTIKVFYDSNKAYRFLLDGTIPNRDNVQLSLCSRNKALPNSLMVQSRHALNIAEDEIVEIQAEEGITNWKYVILGEYGYLFSKGRFPLRGTNETFMLTKSEGTLYLKPLKNIYRRRTK